MTSTAAVSVPIEVASILRHVLRDADLDAGSTARLEDLPGWDSMAHIAVIVEAECRFGIEFDLPEIEAVQTVGDLIDLIEARTGPVDS